MLSNIAASPVDYAAIAAIFVLIATTFGNIILAHKKSNKTKITKEDDSQSVEIKDDAALEKSESVEPVPLKEELSWNARLFKGMARTRNDVWAKVSNIISGNNLAEEMRDELEEILFTADLSPAIVDELLDELPKFSQEEGEPLVKVKEFLQQYIQLGF